MFRLVHITRSGEPAEPLEGLPIEVAEACVTAAAQYEGVGFVLPWTGYLALNGDACVGTCAFKSPPRKGEVEIAYFTFPAFEGRGYATAMAGLLLDSAREAAPEIVFTAQTLPEENASTAVLRKLGFQLEGPVVHPDDGLVWVWGLTAAG